jgi:hypothetical protein
MLCRYLVQDTQRLSGSEKGRIDVGMGEETCTGIFEMGKGYGYSEW